MKAPLVVVTCPRCSQTLAEVLLGGAGVMQPVRQVGESGKDGGGEDMRAWPWYVKLMLAAEGAILLAGLVVLLR